MRLLLLTALLVASFVTLKAADDDAITWLVSYEATSLPPEQG